MASFLLRWYTKDMNERKEQLLQLAGEITANNICAELGASATQLVMGTGSPQADVFIIGEAPGKKEDEQGVPFVGAAGKVLDTMLDSAGMNRSDVYITNIVKYRPPDNRDPLQSEKEAFWPYLVREIEIIKPRVIMTLGRHSMNYFLPGAVIGDVHGTLQEVTLNGQAYTLAPLYHPAAAMYNGKLKATLMEDFLHISEALK